MKSPARNIGANLKGEKKHEMMQNHKRLERIWIIAQEGDGIMNRVI